jgi:hypothetical protein
MYKPMTDAWFKREARKAEHSDAARRKAALRRNIARRELSILPCESIDRKVRMGIHAERLEDQRILAATNF